MLVGVTGAVGLFLLSAGILVIALLLSRRVRLDREKRIALVAIPVTWAPDVDEIWLKAHSGAFDIKLRKVFAVGASGIWGMTLNAPILIMTAFAATAVVWSVTRIVFGLPLWFSLPVSAFFGFWIPRSLLLRQQKKVERTFTDLFPDAVDAMGRMLRAGLPISSAVRSISEESPPPVNKVFALVADQMSIGTSIEDALDASSRRIGLPDFRFFTMAVVLQHMTGGNLAGTLEILSDIVRRRRAVRMKAGATTAEIRVSAYVLGSLPFLIVGALLFIQPGYLTPLFVDPRGHVILAAAAAGVLLAGITMRQMMRSVSTV